MRWESYFMDVALRTARLSYAKRLQVGSVAVRDRRIICVGFNGTAPGEPNCCEDESFVTLPSVIHAEDNLCRFAHRHSIDLTGCDLYITHSPCLTCAEIILKHKFSKVVYLNPYRITDGIELLIRKGINVMEYQHVK